MNLAKYIESLPVASGGALTVKAVKLTAKDARVLLGLLPKKDGSEASPEDGLKNQGNRPYSVSAAKRYARIILLKQWKLNGVSAILGENGATLSIQHRAGGLLLAHKWWDMWRKGETIPYPCNWSESEPPYIEVVLVHGVSEADDVVNTIDTGKNRSVSDVLYRYVDFHSKDKTTRRKLARILAASIRIVWGRVGGKTINNTPAMTQEVALSVLEEHPRLKDMMEQLYSMDVDEKYPNQVSDLIPVAQMSAICYLMAVARSESSDNLDYTLWDQVLSFCTALCCVSRGVPDSSIVSRLHRILSHLVRSGGVSTSKGRDERLGIVIKAWNAWIDGRKTCTSDYLQLTEGEEPRIGGLDRYLS